MPDTDHYIKMLLETNPLREPILRAAIKVLQLPFGSCGLDAGCGIGLQALLLAEAVGAEGHITGLDLSPELLAYARERVHEVCLTERISLREGDVYELPFVEGAFDWAWSVDCVGYAPIEPLPLVKELGRVVRPGGTVAILAWSSENLLPGHPILEARLRATSAGIAPFVKGKNPELHFTRALGWFRDAGIEKCKARTFVGDAHAPLDNDLRQAFTALLQMRWPEVESELTQENWTEYQHLCLPESSDFILDHPDYYAFFTYSLFHGKVVG